jgi:hypothetical protein
VRCRRRVGKLFLAGGRFCCRHCYRLRYASQSESLEWRAHRRLDQIGRKLGVESGHPGLPTRPKGMHASTYERVAEEFFAVEDKVDAFFVAATERMEAGMNRVRPDR